MTETYKPMTKEDFDDFRKQCDSTENWNEVYTTETTKGYTQATESTSALKLKVISYDFKDMDPGLIYDVLHEPEFRRNWDTHLIERIPFKVIDECNDLNYYSLKMPVVSNRDYVYQRGWWYNKDKTEFIICNRSITHPDYPDKKGFVRAIFYISGYMIRKNEKGETVFYYITHNEWNGWIPNWLVNSAGKSVCPKIIEGLFESCKKYPEWKSKHNPDVKPWWQMNKLMKEEQQIE